MTMFSHQSDMDAVGALSPRAVVAYLQKNGWYFRAAYGHYGSVLRRDNEGRQEELIVPISRETADFAKSMSMLVTDLSNIEGRSPYNIISDLTMAPYDVIRVRSPEADAIGSVPMESGVELHEQAWNVATAAANAAAAPRKRAYWKGRQFEKVDDYLKSVRLGQSQRGSFVLSLLSPWDFSPGHGSRQGTLLDDEIPFGRQVTQTLSVALAATRAALREAVSGQMHEAFRRAVISGVSVNLCDALSALAREGDGVDVSVNWSLTNTPDAPGEVLSLRREDSQILLEAKRALVESEPIPDQPVEGVILAVHNSLDSFDGSVVIVGTINNSLRKVRVKFQESDRRLVFDAAQEKLGLRVVGDLQARGNRLELLNPRDITVVRPTDD